TYVAHRSREDKMAERLCLKCDGLLIVRALRKSPPSMVRVAAHKWLRWLNRARLAAPEHEGALALRTPIRVRPAPQLAGTSTGTSSERATNRPSSQTADSRVPAYAQTARSLSTMTPAPHHHEAAVGTSRAAHDGDLSQRLPATLTPGSAPSRADAVEL